MRNKLFSYFDEFVIIFGKDKVTEEGAKIAVDAIEEANDEDEKFVNANENYHEEPQEEIEEENWDDITASTCNTTVATSKRKQTSKKRLRALMGQVTWLSSW